MLSGDDDAWRGGDPRAPIKVLVPERRAADAEYHQCVTLGAHVGGGVFLVRGPSASF